MGFWNRISTRQSATNNAATVVSQLLAALMAAADDEPAKEGDSTGAAVAEPEQAKPKRSSKTNPTTKPQPKKPPHKPLPPWKVLLHNDHVNTFEWVILSILELTPLRELDAIKATEEAHRRGLALLLVTHRERAELFVEQFQTKKLKVTIERAE